MSAGKLVVRLIWIWLLVFLLVTFAGRGVDFVYRGF
jgi:hypothetical protein